LEATEILLIELNKEFKRSYATQIYKQLRMKILNGELMPGERLPSTRALSDELSVSRNTILTAYDMLISEGYIKGVSGSGVYVGNGARTFNRIEKLQITKLHRLPQMK